jgi:predicted Zn-dependent protease
MLDAARTDAEVAGVIAHELSHVVLRHGTAQATKAQKFQLGALAGQILGSIVGGQPGAIIARRSGNGGPEWLSDHPSPSNRYAAINREAALLGFRGSSTRSGR